MIRILRRILAFFRRRTDPDEGQEKLVQGGTNLKTVLGVVTTFSHDHGWIDETIYFNTAVVTGKVPLKVGQKVSAVLEEDKTSHVLKTIKVDTVSDDFADAGPSDVTTRVLISCVTSVTKAAVFISKDVYFSLDIVSEGFVPYKGDWIEVEYSEKLGTSDINAHSVKPMNRRNVSEVFISSMQGRNGLVHNSIFFTLDSLKLPVGYVPRLYDFVNVVIVESVQSCYMWRAISMTPVHMLM